MADDESLPRLLARRYRLESKLGSGGMGVVYRATDMVMERRVAVKLVRGEEGIGLDEEIAGRFLREAKHTAQIQHENIIEVFDLGRSERGDLFFAMELLEGESLSSRLRRLGKVPVETTVHIGRQLCAALEVAHAHGIVHRDLKPANIMLVERAGDPDFVKVLDFGVAKATGPDQQTSLTQTGMLVGTVEYMSPEQIMARPVDGRSDLYSVGVVLYRMLTGKPPFRDAGVPAIIHSHLNVVPPSVVQLAPEVPIALDRIVMRCLAKAPDARYPSMAELGAALDAAFGRMVDLEYDGEEDPYGFGDKTEIARPALADVEPESGAPELDERLEDLRFEDATVKLDRPSIGTRAPSSGSGSGPTVVRGPGPGSGSGPTVVRDLVPPASLGRSTEDNTATIMLQEDVSTAKRSVPEELALYERSGPKTCAMCQTVNAPHARACAACGISLAADDQAAVAARVAAPRTAHRPAPHVPPPTSGAFPSNTGAHAAMSPHGHGPAPVHGAPPWSMVVPAARPPSVWERFLAWAGLRSR